MRILHLIPSLRSGGAERQLGYLAPELARRGHNVHIGFAAEDRFGTEFPGVALHRFRVSSNYSPALFVRISSLINRIKPDIVQTWIPQMDILGGLAAKWRNIPWVLREPNYPPAYPDSWKFRLRAAMAKKASAIVANSPSAAGYWKARLPSVRSFVVQNGLPVRMIEEVEPAVPTAVPENDKPVAASVGRLIDAKGHETFIQAMKKGVERKAIMAVVCGDGPRRPRYEALRRELGLDDAVYFTGRVAAGAVWSLLKKASVFVSLSASEGHPNAVMEAMVCGAPLVLSDIPAHRDILDERSALFVRPGCADEAAEAMVHVLENPREAAQRAAEARLKAQAWSVEAMAEGYEKVYQDCL